MSITITGLFGIGLLLVFYLLRRRTRITKAKILGYYGHR